MIDEAFTGGVFCKELDGGRAGAKIVVSPSAVRATAPDGSTFEITIRECQVDIGGFHGRMVFCRNSDRTLTIFCDHKQFAVALSTASSGLLDNQLTVANHRVRSQKRRNFTVGFAAMVGIVVLLVGCYFGVRTAAAAAIRRMPVSVDRKLGKTALAAMELRGTTVSDEIVVSAMQAIVDRLEPHSAIEAMDFEIHVVDSSEVNAFCLPGGIIVVYTGLIASAENAEQVAAVLGHEMAHATLRHGMERISQSLGIWAAVTLIVGDAGGLIAAGAEQFQYAAVNSYSREQEEAADEEGARMLHAAHIDPASMAEFFQVLEDEHGDVPQLLAWISTHPQHTDRIANVRAITSTLDKTQYQPLDIDWANVQAHVQSSLEHLND